MANRKSAENPLAPVPTEEVKQLYPVVAIGASAGGLQALYQLLENLPSNLGMAYIVIQHLSPTHESILTELLASKTAMPVHKADNEMPIERDHVYVIPPNSFMTITHGKLLLSERVKKNGMHHSVDHFLTALAPVYQSKAIAIILSGSGTDGTAGIQAVKAHGGITFAQDESASFNGMPKTASDSGYTDFVLSCKRIAQELTSLSKQPSAVLTLNEIAEANEQDLKRIQTLLHVRKDVDFSYYKRTTVNRRIFRRMSLNKLSTLEAYIRLLRENAQEVDLLYKDLLINVTSFFREPDVYEALGKKIFPEIVKNLRPNDTIRIWTPACANGEEAYSIAISLFEYLKDKDISNPIQIFGTDLNEAAIEKARAGIYNKSVMENMSPQNLKRYFQPTGGQFQIIKAIRDVCVFATHDLLKDPPFSRMDLISCQNVFIYLEAAPQRKILQAFNYALKQNGYLLLGKSESLGNSTELFSHEDKELKIYAKKDVPPGNAWFDFNLRPGQKQGIPLDDSGMETHHEFDLEKDTQKLLLSRYVPASVVINKDLQILHFHGPTSEYLQPSSGKASLSLLRMVRDELVFELKGLISRAKKEMMPVKKEGVPLLLNQVTKEITLEVAPIQSAGNDTYYLIVFRDVVVLHTAASAATARRKDKDSKDERISRMEQQLTEAREHMKTMSEEFEATREELQSASEEVLSSNEELQSINEELETSKEELQSSNEELVTINEELQQRNNDLREMTDYMHAIIESMNEPLLVLNEDMRVRTANKAFYAFFRTHAGDTEGQYFFKMSNGLLDLPDLRRKLQTIVQNGKSFDNYEAPLRLPSQGEKTLLFNATLMKQEDVKKNRVLLMIQDVTPRRKAEQELKDNSDRFLLMVQHAFDLMSVFSRSGSILFQSDMIERSLGYKAADTLGKTMQELGIVHPEDSGLLDGLFEESVRSARKNISGHIRLRHQNGSYLQLEVVFRNLLKNRNIKGILGNWVVINAQEET